MTAVPLPAPLGESQVGSAWRLNPYVGAILLVIAALYVAGTVVVRRRGGHWPLYRTVLFLLGLVLFAWTTMSFLAVYQQVMFWPRAVQIITLLMVVPLFLALGMPLTMAIEGGPRRLAALVRWVLATRIAALLTFPAVVSIVFLVTPFTVYFSPIYEDTLRSRGAAWVLSFALSALGFFYYWTRLRLDPVPKEYPHLVSVWITFAEAIADGALGLTLMLGHHLVAGDWYTALNRPGGLTPKQDQVWGGGALWLIGDLAGVPFLGALWRRMFDEDRDRAAEVDAELDALEAEGAIVYGTASGSGGGVGAGVGVGGGGVGSGGAPSVGGGADAQDDVDASSPASISHTSPATVGAAPAGEEAKRTRPWWETDPVLGRRMGFLDEE
ncbi:cytochrome c oxidase assembly protein [Catenulispora acidiphila]|uniref:cytochrome c oxidase assembly protein n=1 Tax=Catenulispora acidiphila TaxID=304895 RepID=UPI00167FDF68|nr:cytochrome c oxidase assembly protein [Catenulispora acidiphila]